MATEHDRPETYGGDGLDLTRDRLTLRFESPALERQFQLDLGARLRFQLQGGLLLGLSLWVTAAALLPFMYGTDPATLALAVSIPIVVLVGAMIAIRRVRSWDAQQVVNGITNFVGGLSMIYVSTTVVGAPELLPAALTLNAIFAFSVVRMGFVTGLAAQLPVLIWLGALAWIGEYPEIGWFGVFLVASAMGVAAFGAYMLESSSRARFLQQQTLEEQREALAREIQKSDALLHTMLPPSVADRLRDQPGVIADAIDEATVIFSDIVGFTPIGSAMAPTAVVSVLNELFGRFDALAAELGLEKIKTIGDGYMAVAGAPLPVVDHADRAVRFGLALVKTTEALGAEVGVPLHLRVGIHTGPLVAGVIGRDKLAYDLWGDTVNVASRMESQGLPGRVQISGATAERLRTDVALEPRGTIEVRGRGPMRVLLVAADAVAPEDGAGGAAGQSADELPPDQPALKMPA